MRRLNMNSFLQNQGAALNAGTRASAAPATAQKLLLTESSLIYEPEEPVPRGKQLVCHTKQTGTNRCAPFRCALDPCSWTLCRVTCWRQNHLRKRLGQTVKLNASAEEPVRSRTLSQSILTRVVRKITQMSRMILLNS